MTDPYGPPPGQDPPGGPSPAASGAPTQEERNWALAAHIGSLVAAWFAFGFLAPLLVMLLKENSPYVRRHAVESLNFQISVLIYLVVGAIVAFVLTIVTLGIGLVVIIPVAIAFGLAVLVLILMGTVKAANGQHFRYPLTIRLVR